MGEGQLRHAFLAAAAATRGLAVVTRNTGGFRNTGVATGGMKAQEAAGAASCKGVTPNSPARAATTGRNAAVAAVLPVSSVK